MKALANTSQNNSRESRPEIAAAFIGVQLARLALHYFRPDIAASQVKSIAADFVEDLGEFDQRDIHEAFKAYRQNPENKIFPRPGPLRDLTIKAKVERVRAEQSPGGVYSVRDGSSFERANRPLCWYMRPKSKWRPEWRESDVPEDYRPVGFFR